MKKLTFLSIGLLILATGCSKSVRLDGQNATSDAASSGGSAGSNGGSSTITTQIICDPLGNGLTVPGPWSGLKASLRYLDPTLNSSSPANVGDILTNGTLSTASIFMSELNVPTHEFTEGFTTTGGDELTTSSGDPLLENFAISFDSKIRLADYDQPGLKQFAVMSDDGAILYLDQGQGLAPVVNNDGLHATGMACAQNAVWMGQGQDYPIHLDYYQGPRYEISLLLLWRNIPDQDGTGEQDSPILDPRSLKDPSCGQYPDDYFDSSTTPPTPTAAWDKLRDRGWSVVPAVNYVLPGQDPNPCASPTI